MFSRFGKWEEKDKVFNFSGICMICIKDKDNDEMFLFEKSLYFEWFANQ